MRREPHETIIGKNLFGVGDSLLVNERKCDGFYGKTMVGMSTRVKANTIEIDDLVSVTYGQFEPSGLF